MTRYSTYKLFCLNILDGKPVLACVNAYTFDKAKRIVLEENEELEVVSGHSCSELLTNEQILKAIEEFNS